MQWHVDGELVDHRSATVPVRDRGFRFGDGAVETLRVYGGTLFQWDDHLERLFDTCTAMGLDHEFGAAELRARIEATLSANELQDAVVTLSITRGPQPGDVWPAATVDPTVVVTVTAAPRGGRSGTRRWEEPATVQTVRTRRIPPACLPGPDTTHNRLNTVLACQELRSMAADRPADDALVRDLDGAVVGGARAALCVVTEAGLHTPAPEGTDAPSITRATVQALADAEDIPVREGVIDREEVYDAAEVFLANTSWEIRPVRTVDGIAFDPGPVTALLATRYDDRVEHACY